jgi:hypothetical protein
MSDAPNPNVITIDGRAIEYRLERRDGTTALQRVSAAPENSAVPRRSVEKGRARSSLR